MRRLLARAALSMLLVLFLVAVTNRALAYTPPPVQGYVTDTAHKLSPAEVTALDEKLAAYRICSTNHVIVFITDSLVGDTVEDVAYATFNTWKPGQGKDNGVLLVIAPNERKVRIETGKGVGGALTDVESNRILREHVSANLEKDQFFAAVDEGTTEIERALQRDAKPTDKPCAVTAATRPAPAASVSAAAPVSSAGTASRLQVEPAPAPAESVFGVFRLVLFVMFAAVWATIFAPSRGDGLVFGVFTCIGAGLIGGLVCSSVLPAFIGEVGTAIAGAVVLVLVIVGRIFAGRARARSVDYGDGSSTSSWDSGSSSSSGSSSGASSWDTGSSSSDTSGSSGGSSGVDTSYTGGDGSSGGGGSSDSY